MADDKITISDAVKQLQEWFDEKEYEKVILGSKEVLNIDQKNEIAQTLLNRSEEMKKNKENDIQFPNLPNKNDSSEKIDASSSKISEEIESLPLEKDLKFPIDTSENEGTSLYGFDNNHGNIKNVMGYLLRKIATIIVIFAILGGIGYGAFTGYQYYQNKKTSNETNKNTKNTEENATENDELAQKNEQRQNDLEILKSSIEKYFTDKGEFPPAENVEKKLIENGYIASIPVDPLHGEKDRYDKPYGYIYAVYENEKGNNQEYIISAKFENPNQIDSPWSPNDTSKHEDFRDLTKNNVKMLEAYAPSTTTGNSNPPEPKDTPSVNDIPVNGDTPTNDVPPRKKIKRTTMMMQKINISPYIMTFSQHV